MTVAFHDEHGTKLVNRDMVTLGLPIGLRPDQNEFAIRIAQLHLNPGVYTMGFWLANPQHTVLDRIDRSRKTEVLVSPWIVGSVRPQFDGVVSLSF